MTTSVGTVAWIGTGGVIIGAVVGAFASWITAVVTSTRAAGEARNERRREAYGAFLGSLDEILSLYLTPEDFGRQLKEDSDFAPLARQALSSISKTSVAVVLAGSKEARAAVKGIENARWGLYAILKKPDDLAGLSSQLQQIAELQTSFGDLAKDELASPRPRRGILRKRRPAMAGDPMLDKFTGYVVRDETEHATPNPTHALFVGFRHDLSGLNAARKIATDRSGKFGPQIVVDVASGAGVKVLRRFVDSVET